MQRNEIIDKVISLYGAEHQSIVAIEEMSELIKELSKHYRGESNERHIAEEVADVEIMLMQLKKIYDITYDVEMWKSFKFRRLEERLTAKLLSACDTGIRCGTCCHYGGDGNGCTLDVIPAPRFHDGECDHWNAFKEGEND